MITADPKSALGHWCRTIAAMEPGQCLDVRREDMMDIAGFEHNGAHFAAPDRILENIVGSAYTHSYSVHPSGQKVTFRRHEQTGDRRYHSPDHRSP